MDGPSTQIVVCFGGQLETGRDVVAGVEHEVDVLLAAEPLLEAVQDLLDPAAPLPARRALAARLAVEELGDPPRRPHTDRCPSSITTIEPEPSIEPALPTASWSRPRSSCSGPNHGADTPPGMNALQRDIARDAAPERGVVDQVPERRLRHLDLEPSRILDAPGQSEEPGAGRRALAERGERVAAVGDDPGQIGHGLDVVDDGRLSVKADGGGKVRRLDAREAALSLEALEQRGLLAADVGARARMDHDVEREARAEDVRAEGTVGVRLVARPLQALEAEGEFAPAVDERPAPRRSRRPRSSSPR